MPESFTWNHEQALVAMHARLVDYGLCFLRGGRHWRAENYIVEWDSDEVKRPRAWSQIEIDAAAALHSRIIRLPLVVHSIVLQVFYAETCAPAWDRIDPPARYDIICDLVRWNSRPFGVNARLARRARETGERLAPIAPDDFEAIRGRAMRILCNTERVTAAASLLHPCDESRQIVGCRA